MTNFPISGVQHDKQHGITVVATAAIEAHRFIAYDGGYALGTPDLKDVQCISETAAQPGEAFCGVTSYSYPVLASEALNRGDYVKPAADGSGRAAKGSAAEHSARALHAVSAGRLVECQLVYHVNVPSGN
ncbi:MAG: DUF2190 domain-containing protein [Comamonas sp.]|nr:DUF2190 domain-containing protein [Comamonas sp.]